MVGFLGMYLLIGFLWMLLLMKIHPGIRYVRESAGDLKAVVLMLPVALFWPVEVFALIAYFVLVMLNLLRGIWLDKHAEKWSRLRRGEKDDDDWRRREK